MNITNFNKIDMTKQPLKRYIKIFPAYAQWEGKIKEIQEKNDSSDM